MGQDQGPSQGSIIPFLEHFLDFLVYKFTFVNGNVTGMLFIWRVITSVDAMLDNISMAKIF